MRSKFLMIFFIGLAISTCLASTDMYLASMPDMAIALSVSESFMNFTISIFFIGNLCTGIIIGPFSDSYGRTNILKSGMLLYFLASFFCMVMESGVGLLIARLCQGASLAVMWVVGIATVHEMLNPKKATKALSWLGMASAAIPAIAPALGGIIHQNYGWRANFLVMCASSLFCLIGMHFFFLGYEKPKEKKSFSLKKFLTSYRVVLKNRTFLKYVVMTPNLFSGEMFFIAVLPFYFIETIGLSYYHFGLYLIPMVISYLISLYISQRCITAIGDNNTIFLGALCCLLGAGSEICLHYTYPYAVNFIVLGFSIYTFGMGLVYPSSLSNALQSIKEKGTATAVRSVLLGSGAALGAFGAAIFPDNTLLPTGVYLLLCSVLLLMNIQRVRNSSRYRS